MRAFGRVLTGVRVLPLPAAIDQRRRRQAPRHASPDEHRRSHPSRDHVAVVLRNGYCQLYNTEGKLVTTYSVNDAKFVRFVGDDQLAIHRRNGRVEIHDFTGRLVRVSA